MVRSFFKKMFDDTRTELVHGSNLKVSYKDMEYDYVK